jgi:hypothetical protein
MFIAFNFSFLSAANASIPFAAKKYANCTALNKDYPGGVSKSSKTKNKGGKTKKTPKVSASIYAANSKMDRGKDGIACEK